MKPIKETAKAVLLTLRGECPSTDQVRTRDVWVPKSQLDSDGVPGEWITAKKAEEAWQGYPGLRSLMLVWVGADGEECTAGETAAEAARREAREAKAEAGLTENLRLKAIAAAAGLVAAGRRYKTQTLIAKLDAAGISY